MTTTEVRERPILFSAPMVRAILDGRKTQTRRIVKPQPVERIFVPKNGPEFAFVPPQCVKGYLAIGVKAFNDGGNGLVRCPYGVPGDRLWVRETWQEVGDAYYYKATDADKYASVLGDWKPSIHLPRLASRITLEVTAVKVERVQSISEEDAIAEGMKPHPGEPYDCMDDPREQFRMLWDSINGTGSWASNPWVWAITFKVIKP